MPDLFNRRLAHFTGDQLPDVCRRLRAKGIDIETRGRGRCHVYVNDRFTGGVVARRTSKGWTFNRFGTVTNGAIEEIHAFVLNAAPHKAGTPDPGISSTGVQKPKRGKTAPM